MMIWIGEDTFKTLKIKISVTVEKDFYALVKMYLYC